MSETAVPPYQSGGNPHVAPLPSAPPPIDIPSVPIDWKDPASVAMYLSAVFAVVAFVLHKDLTSLAGPIALVVVGALAAVKAIVAVIQHRTLVTASLTRTRLAIDDNFSRQDLVLRDRQLNYNFPELAQREGRLSSGPPTADPGPEKRAASTRSRRP